jgi:hypothetical protein
MVLREQLLDYSQRCMHASCVLGNEAAFTNHLRLFLVTSQGSHISRIPPVSEQFASCDAGTHKNVGLLSSNVAAKPIGVLQQEGPKYAFHENQDNSAMSLLEDAPKVKQAGASYPDPVGLPRPSLVEVDSFVCNSSRCKTVPNLMTQTAFNHLSHYLADISVIRRIDVDVLWPDQLRPAGFPRSSDFHRR